MSIELLLVQKETDSQIARVGFLYFDMALVSWKPMILHGNFILSNLIKISSIFPISLSNKKNLIKIFGIFVSLIDMTGFVNMFIRKYIFFILKKFRKIRE